ncbi:MAG: PP2C family protein-serine/threonine phosphatase [Lachnospiraceae bacterium]|nr:PP2C family protein-serine/threonine phosphatase [Lachnospiraceae bacterium]
MKNKNTGKKEGRIVVEIGAFIIVLFTLVTIAVGNMVTMASFSTALNANLYLYEYYMGNLEDIMGEYKALSWLMDYWKGYADNWAKEETVYKEAQAIDDILTRLSKKSARDVTPEEAAALPEEDQKRFALWSYKELQKEFSEYEDDEEDFYIILAMADSEQDTPIVILSNVTDVKFGTVGDVENINQVIANTDEAERAEVWKWAFSTPESMMLFGTRLPIEGYKGSYYANMLGAFPAQTVYDSMTFTATIRNEVIVMMFLVLILILLVLYFIVPRPLEKLKRLVTEYSDTKDTAALTRKLSDIQSKNEIGALADEFSSMAQEMERYTQEMEVLAAEKERVATELSVATNIQIQMLPHVFPQRDRFDLYASSKAAKEVGGDFYDSYMIDDDHLAMTIADVSGKGVPASLFMAVSKTMLKNRTLVGGSPASVLKDVNNWLCEGNDSCMFVTVWHGILTISTGELVCANAGHENPGFRMGDEPFRLIRKDHGLALGLIENEEFVEEHYRLSSGDAVFVYTDGVPESHALDESMFGEDRLEQVLSTVAKDAAPREIMEKVGAAVEEFAGDAPQYDDITMLCLIIN